MIRSTSLPFVWRMLRKSPATSALAVAALALGIGLSATMFSIVHGVLLAQAPFAEPDRLMDLTLYDPKVGPLGSNSTEVPVHDFVDWSGHLTGFEGLAASTIEVVNLNDEAGYPERFRAGVVTGNLFRMLGVEPALGRVFTPEDDVPGAPRVVVLGHDAWRHRFAGDPAVLGRSIRVDGEPTTVIGVMPPGFEFPVFEDLWLPMRLDVAELPRGEGGTVWAIGRLRDGVSRREAQAELEAVAGRLAEEYPETNAGRAVLVRDYRSSLNSDADLAIVGAMFAAVCLVLVIACANVASLLLARASLRAREMAVRTALGAHRGRVIGLLMTEALLLSALGSVLGLGLAKAGTAWLVDAFSWRTMPFWITFELRPAAVVFVIAAGVVAGVLSGVLPALRASGAVTFDLLKDESRGSTGLRIGRVTRALVVAELALACALLVVTGLMVRTVVNYHQADLGFATDSIFTAGLALPEREYPESADAAAFYERLTDDLRGLPEVVEAAVMSRPPGTFMGSSYYAVEDGSYATQGDYPSAPRGLVGPGFFDVYGIRPLEGRVFDRRDDADAPAVAVVNASFAAAAWPGESAVGKRLKLGRSRGDAEEPWREVVGVVPDAGVGLLNPGTTHAGFYVPHAQLAYRTMSVAVKTRGEAAAFGAVLREHVRRLDAGLPVDAEKTMERVVWEETFSTKVITVVFSAMGLAAVLLAAVGIFGVMTFSVQQRTQEMGLRMALGARPAEVLRLVLRQGLGRLALGLTLGLGLAWLLASSLRVALFGVEPGDPATFLATAAVLAAVALAACLVPAWRAARVDPLVALRYE
ncbi:MAG TPA: ABC transporter permease [Thermoanaerobaculia bacterium]|jgi:predicted permease